MDFAEFAAYHRPALERDEARNNMMLGNISWLLTKGPPYDVKYWSLGAPGECAMQVSGTRPIVLGALNEDQCRHLASQLGGTFFNGVVGADRKAIWFADHAVAAGVSFHEPMPQQILAISQPPIYPGASGQARLVHAADADLFADWSEGFRMEAVPHEPSFSRENTDRMAASGRFLFWQADDVPVSMAGIVRMTRNAAAIAFVYTPPQLRARGYGGSAVAALVDHIYASGKTMVCLFVDLRNPSSNRCYAKVGFKPVCDSWFFMQKPL